MTNPDACEKCGWWVVGENHSPWCTDEVRCLERRVKRIERQLGWHGGASVVVCCPDELVDKAFPPESRRSLIVGADDPVNSTTTVLT